MLAGYKGEQLQFLIEFLCRDVEYQEERMRRLEALKASEANESWSASGWLLDGAGPRFNPVPPPMSLCALAGQTREKSRVRSPMTEVRTEAQVFSIWESRFPPEHVRRGREVTESIWEEMPRYSGYIRHVVIEDLDEPGHLFVVSEWESREAADDVLADYAGTPNARLANELVAEPRRRMVGRRFGLEK